jgi:hypothetical protein
MGLKLSNNAISQLASAITASDTLITLNSGDGSKFPTLGSGDYHPATISKPDGTFEIVKVTARSGDTLTVTRAQEGTTALSFTQNCIVELRLTAETIAEFENRTISTTAEAIAGTDDTKIMTPAKVKAAISASQAVVNNETTTYKLITVGGVLALIQQ